MAAGRVARSQGEIEAAVCDVIARFQQEYMGRGPRDIHTHLIDNKLFVHLQGVLTAAEQRLIESHASGNGREQSCSSNSAATSCSPGGRCSRNSWRT